MEQAGLGEIDLSCRSFTWCNDHENPTFEKLDRVVVNMEWEMHYPLAKMEAMARALSDHVPQLLDTGAGANNVINKPFTFELSWFLRDDIVREVEKIWTTPVGDLYSIHSWQAKLQILHIHLKGWNLNQEGWYRKLKKDILANK